jgi:hypothetical protein
MNKRISFSKPRTALRAIPHNIQRDEGKKKAAPISVCLQRKETLKILRHCLLGGGWGAQSIIRGLPLFAGVLKPNPPTYRRMCVSLFPCARREGKWESADETTQYIPSYPRY